MTFACVFSANIWRVNAALTVGGSVEDGVQYRRVMGDNNADVSDTDGRVD